MTVVLSGVFRGGWLWSTVVGRAGKATGYGTARKCLKHTQNKHNTLKKNAEQPLDEPLLIPSKLRNFFVKLRSPHCIYNEDTTKYIECLESCSD
jgi:hypothetical protein